MKLKKIKMFFLLVQLLACVLSLNKIVLAQEVYGCARDEYIMFKEGVCSDKTPAERVEESRIFFGDPPALYSSNINMGEYGIDPNKTVSIAVLYNCNGKTFKASNCQGQKKPKGSIIVFKYFSGTEKSYDGLLSNKPLPDSIVRKFPIRNLDLSNQNKLIERRMAESFKFFKKDMESKGITNPNEIKEIWDSMPLEGKISKD